MKKYIILILIILAIFIALIYLPILEPLSPFQTQSLVAKSMESIKTLTMSEFRSASYNYKTLFPYDFIYGEPQWGTLLYKNNKFLTEEDKLNKLFYSQCKEIGIDLNRDTYFFTITTKAYAGFDINDYIKEPIISTNSDDKIIILKSPDSKILSLEVLDTLKDEEFPDINITPGQWQKLIELLLPKIEDDIIERGLISSSDESNRLFIKKLFISMGWKDVEFK